MLNYLLECLVFSFMQRRITKNKLISVHYKSFSNNIVSYCNAAVPGLPIIGNLHQLKEKKPHQTFAKWSETYGPIYTIKTGASPVVVLNSTEVAKEVCKLSFFSIFLLPVNVFIFFPTTQIGVPIYSPLFYPHFSFTDILD